MRYPGTIQYLEALNSARELTSTLGDIKLVRDYQGEPIFSSGGFGVVFKVEVNGEEKALKCFTREQPGRKIAYRVISQHFHPAPPYIINFNYIEDEIYVFSDKGEVNQYSVLLMDWVDGETLSVKIHRASINGQHEQLAQLSANFDELSLWLLSQDFAHGDIKPDNIIVKSDGVMVLVDYDGIYLPQMQGECQREIGTIGFQHPCRAEMAFSKAIDHYSIAILSLTLRVLAQYPQFYVLYRSSGGLIFNPQNIFEKEDSCYNQLGKSNFAEHPLYKILESRHSKIDNLADMISKGKIDLSISQPAEKEFVKKMEIHKEAGKYGFVDQNGIPAVATKYDAVCQYSEDLAAVQSNGRWGSIDQSGRICIQPIYDSVSDMSEGMAVVSLDGKYGYVNSKGQSVVPLRYDNAWSFREGFALVKKRGKYGFIDKDGNVAISVQFDFVSSFSEGYACARRDKLYGYIDKLGRWAIKPKYDFASRVKIGVATVELGDEVIQLQFPPNRRYREVDENAKWSGLINSNVL